MNEIYNGTKYSIIKTKPFIDTYSFQNNSNGWKLICFNLAPLDNNILYFSHWFSSSFILDNNIESIDILSNDIQYTYRKTNDKWNKNDVDMPINIQLSYYIKITRSDTVNETTINWEGYLIKEMKFDKIKKGENIFMSSFTTNSKGVAMNDTTNTPTEEDLGLIQNSEFKDADDNEIQKSKIENFNTYIKSVYTFTEGGMLIQQELPSVHNLSTAYYNLFLTNKIGIAVNMTTDANLSHIDITISNDERVKDFDDEIISNLNLNIHISI